MSLEIKIEAKDIEQLQFWFEEIEKRINFSSTEAQEALKERLQKVMSDDVQKRFDSSPSTTAGGTVHGDIYWKPLTESYLANRPDRAQGRIYIDSQNLMRSFNVSSPNLISRFTQEGTYEFGTRIPYAEKLQSMRQIVFFYDLLLDKLALEFLEWAIELPEGNKLKQKKQDINESQQV